MTREEAKVYIIRHCNPDYPKGKMEWEQAVNMAIKALEQSEIIRCKECKYSHMTYDGDCKYCEIWFPDEAEYMDGNYYCGSAERRHDALN